MARTAAQDKIFKQERLVGLRAARMVESYLHAVLKQKLDIHNQGMPEEPIMEATDVKRKMGEYRLLGLNLRSSKTGFILHHGFVGIREATTVYFSASRYNVEKTQRARHRFTMQPFNLFNDIYEKSGAVDYLVAELSKTRTKAVEIKLQNLAIQFNSEDNG
ncbi:hypothetical protein MG296_10485 [Flavobacteriaceae bacterium TK19130]|nr:hypothetical protein [Thermobacterium salinum]